MTSSYLQKVKKEMETLLQAIGIYIQDIGMELSIEKCAMLIMKKGKKETVETIELLNQESIRMLGEIENYKYLGILEMDIIKKAEMKTKNIRVN